MRRHLLQQLLAVLTLTCLPLLAPAQESASIVIRAQQEQGPVNWRVFGHNIEAADRRGVFNQPLDSPIIEPLGVMRGQGFWDPDANAPIPSVLQMARDIHLSVLRYPGGCLAHRYDWKQSVGPLAERPNWKFGLVEYLELCRQLGAEPIITVSEYVLPAEELPQHAAELVEFLNSPATTDHPWAMKRKAWGHAEPFNVKWFELGNESNHGNHKVIPHRQYTGDEYADYFLATARAMRAVDPTIKLGLVTTPGFNTQDTWTRRVVARAGQAADFLIIHFYAPNGKAKSDESLMDPLTVQSCMAAGDQLEYRIQQFRVMSRELCGRDLPLAMTEFNVGPGLVRPAGYDLASSLFLADFLRVMLKPDNNVLMAHYWHLLNAYWGIVQTGNGDARAFAPYHMYRLWAQHFGQTLVETQVQSPRIDFRGIGMIKPASGPTFQPQQQLGNLTLDAANLKTITTGAIRGEIQPDGQGYLEITNQRSNLYPVLMRMKHPVAAGCDYRIRFESRFINASKKEYLSLGLAMQDDRGYTATQSGMVVSGLQSSEEWQPRQGVYHSLSDSTGIELLGHAVTGARPEDQAVSGRLEIRNLKIDLVTREKFAAYAELTAMASLSQDKDTLYVIVFNKSIERDLPTTIDLPDFSAASLKRWEINGPSAASLTDIKETLTNQDVPVTGGKITLTFPAHSMTALEFRRK